MLAEHKPAFCPVSASYVSEWEEDVRSIDHVYLSGRMSGLPDFNRESFSTAKKYLEKLGVERVTNPHELTEPVNLSGDPDIDWHLYLYRDLSYIRGASCSPRFALVTLPDWEDSPGSVREVEYARKHGVKVLPFPEFTRLLEGKREHGVC